MAATTLPEEQLLELLTQLQKTTPEQIKAILNPQPAIANGLLKLMIKLDLINAESLMQHLSGIAGAAAGATSDAAVAPNPNPAPVAPTPAVAPVPAAPMPHPPFLPPHLAQQAHIPSHTPTPPLMPPPPPGLGAAPYHQYGSLPPGPPPPSRPGSYPSYPPGLSMPPPPHLANMGYHTPPPPMAPPSAPYHHQQQQQPGGYASQAQTAPPVLPPLPEVFAHLPEDQKATMRHVMSMTPAQVQQLPPAERSGIMQLRATLGLPSE